MGLKKEVIEKCSIHEKLNEMKQSNVKMNVVEDIMKVIDNTHDANKNKDMKHEATIHETGSVSTEVTDASPLDSDLPTGIDINTCLVLSVMDLPEKITKVSYAGKIS